MDLSPAGWRPGPTTNGIRNTFLAAGLRLGEYRTLAQWIWRDADLTHRAERGQLLFGALELFLNGGGKPGPGMVAGLFPPEVKMRDLLWEVASGAFADRHWYAPAAELGTRVYALTPSNRSEYALKIAQWELYAGNPAHAKAVLRDAIEGDRGESFEPGTNSVFAALRAYFLLLPEGERAAFAEDYPRRMRDAGEQVHATLAAVLLHGLAGDERAARQNLDDLIAMRLLSTSSGGTTPDARRWGYVMNNGAQLLAWNLDGLAAYYWRHALKEASAFERQDGDTMNFQAEIRARLLGVDVAMASDPQQGRESVETYLRTGPAWEIVTATAAQMMAASQFPAAARLYEALCRARPNEPENWRQLFLAYESGGDRAALERTLATLLASPGPLPANADPRRTRGRLANLRYAEDDDAGACWLLEHLHQSLPGLLPLLFQLAPMEEQAGRWEEAARVWAEAVPLDPGGGACMALARTRKHLRQPNASIAAYGELMRSAPEPVRSDAAARLTRLYLRLHRTDDARALAAGSLRTAPPPRFRPSRRVWRRPDSRRSRASCWRRRCAERTIPASGTTHSRRLCPTLPRGEGRSRHLRAGNAAAGILRPQ